MKSWSSRRADKILSNIFQIRELGLESKCFRYVNLLVTSETASNISGKMLQKQMKNKPWSKNLETVMLSFQV